MVDRYIIWVKVVPTPDITAKAVAGAFFKTWIARFGAPSKITTNQGRQFESRLFKALAHLLGIKRIRSSSYHPQTYTELCLILFMSRIHCQHYRATDSNPSSVEGLGVEWLMHLKSVEDQCPPVGMV
ncbi:integrase catalytic domain-containing protein [Trichonephila clavipes]|nr:integrase catalytic domain-containing protein [Trichonephila clavipes]